MSLLLYPEDEMHQKAFEYIKQNYDYCGILHDKDVTEDGEIKKAHWHIILRFKNANWNSSICKELGIELNYTEQIRNFDNAMMYLIHYNDSDKTQYDISEVFGTFKNRLNEILANQNKSEGEKVTDLINYIEEYDEHLTISHFSKWCAQNGYWAEFRRAGAIICKIIEEHNQRIIARNNDYE